MKISHYYAPLLIGLGTLALGLALYTQDTASLIFFLSGLIGIIMGGVCAIRQGFEDITENVTHALSFPLHKEKEGSQSPIPSSSFVYFWKKKPDLMQFIKRKTLPPTPGSKPSSSEEW